jgi:hypothetical protein
MSDPIEFSRNLIKGMRGSTDVNLEQLRVGLAWWYREYAKEQTAKDRTSYAAAEDMRARRVAERCEAVLCENGGRFGDDQQFPSHGSEEGTP